MIGSVKSVNKRIAGTRHVITMFVTLSCGRHWFSFVSSHQSCRAFYLFVPQPRNHQFLTLLRAKLCAEQGKPGLDHRSCNLVTQRWSNYVSVSRPIKAQLTLSRTLSTFRVFRWDNIVETVGKLALGLRVSLSGGLAKDQRPLWKPGFLLHRDLTRYGAFYLQLSRNRKVNGQDITQNIR